MEPITSVPLPSTAAESWTWTPQDLTARLSHGRADVRAWALRRLTLFAPRETGLAAVRLLDDRSLPVQGTALTALETVNPRDLPGETLDALRAWLGDRDRLPEMRGCAQELITAIQEGRASAHVTAIPQEWVNLSAAEVLGGLRKNSSEEDSDAALAFLSARPHELRLAAPAHLARTNSETTLVVLEALQRQPYPWATDLLIGHLDALLSSELDVLTIEALEELADPASLPALIAEWRPGEPRFARVICFIAEVAGTARDLPVEIAREADQILHVQNEFFREVGASVLRGGEIPLPKIDSPRLELRCARCRRTYSYDVGEVSCAPPKKRWLGRSSDGVTPMRVIVCKKCGAVDEYEVTARTHALLTAAMMPAAMSGKMEDLPPWIRPGAIGLWDGTRVDRPSQGIRRLREQAVKRPDKVASWRRIGNFCRRVQEFDQAVEAYHKALEVDPDDIESIYGLAETFRLADRLADVMPLLERFLSLLPRAKPDRDLKFEMTVDILALLRMELKRDRRPCSLLVAWGEEESKREVTVTMSALDLREDWEGREIAQFLVEDAVTASLSDEPVKDPPILLERRLRERRRSRPPVPTSEQVSRNTPCPCGSGKKYKRCCGRSG